MLNQPELTVIVPCYNMEKYIARALDHLAKQVNKNFKLLIINDGSTDNSAEEIEKYRHTFPFFKLINTENQGPSAARNTALKMVDTPYFTFHDGDDFVDPGYTDFFLQAFKRYPEVDLVSCGYFVDYPKKASKVMGHPEAGFLTKSKAYLKLTNIFSSPVKGYSWNKAYKTKIVQKSGLTFDTDIALLEDQIFNAKYIAMTSGFYYTQKPYYHYWQRKDSLVHRPSLKKVIDNFVSNYRVWSCIIKSLMEERKKRQNMTKEVKNESYSQ